MSKRKKTLPQQVVNVATTGMPSPVRKTLGSRVVALLIVVALPLMLFSGVLSIDWENGRPKVSFNQKRAKEVKEEATETIQDLRETHTADRGLPGLPEFGDGDSRRLGFAGDTDRTEGFRDKLGEQAAQLTGRVGEGVEQVWPGNDQERATDEAKGPLSKLKQRFDRR